MAVRCRKFPDTKKISMAKFLCQILRLTAAPILAVLPGSTSQRHSALISSDSEYFQVCFSAVHYLKISEQRWFRENQSWSALKQSWSALMFIMFSESALKNVETMKQRCSALITSGTSTRVGVMLIWAREEDREILADNTIQWMLSEADKYYPEKSRHGTPISSRKTFPPLITSYWIQVQLSLSHLKRSG